MSNKMKTLAMLSILSVITLSISCGGTLSAEKRPAAKAAPDFTLKALNGKSVTLSSYKNKKDVLLVFGATWCPHCVTEIPELKEVYKKYNDRDIELLYIDVQESSEKLSAFAKDHSIPYTVLLDSTGEVAKDYGVLGIPHQVIIAKDGTISYEGPRPRQGLISLLEKLMAD